jgi:nucleotidyltransferase/DNA polymerase involved in DNA repair
VGAGVEEAACWVQALRLVTLRGIGTANAGRLAGVGIRDIRTLAMQDPDSLAARLRTSREVGATRARPTPAEVRVWVQAALKASESER